MPTGLTEEKVRKVVREEISIFPALRMLNNKLDGLEGDIKSFRKEFVEFKNQNLTLLDKFCKLDISGC